MNAQLIADYLAENYAKLAKGQHGLIHMAVCMTGGTVVVPKAKFVASVGVGVGETRGESDFDMETAVRRCAEAQDPKARAAALRTEGQAKLAEADRLERGE